MQPMFHIFLFIGILLIAGKLFVRDGAGVYTESMFLRLYKKDTSFVDVDVRNAEQLFPLLRRNEPLVLYIHGYKENANYEGPKIISQAYLEHTDHNVLAVDYREIADMLYTTSVALVDDIGKAIADALNTIVFSDVNVTNVHILGHSLGSQIAGSAARQTKFNVSRITGFDPAGPLFYFLNRRLTPADADFVDIIHTDMAVYGLIFATGHVDFYPNYGYRPQPGCAFFGPILTEKELCSHHRSYVFYADSIKNNNYVAISCTSQLRSWIAKCNQSDVTVMGYRTPSTARGQYFLNTNAQSPYGQGSDGIKSFISDNNML